MAVPVALLGLCGSVAIGANATGGGGIGAPTPPAVTDVTCQERCAGLREAAAGSRIQVSGRSLDHVVEVQFNQRGGGRIGSEALNASATAVEALVPDDAETGKPQVVDGGGNVSESPQELKIVAEQTVQSDDGAGIGEVSASPAKGFFMGKQQATASFIAKGSSPQDVRVDVVSKDDGATVRSIVAEKVEPQSPAQVSWNGKTESGDVAPNGAYDFEVKPLAGGESARAGFEQYDHMFPLIGKHDFWAGLGDGRGHQGVDVGAKCGKRIVAARGGKVQTKAYHGSAGNYVVIDGKDTNVDYVYMHLQQPSKLHEGEKVKTGGLVGRNGDTGNASGCHLHFEMWDGDWYGGGKVMDPMPHLKRWDDWS